MSPTRRFVLQAAAAFPFLTALPARAGAPEAVRADAALDAAFTTGAPPAMAAAIVTTDGLAWSGVRGVRKSGVPDPALVDDRWHLGSNTKAMTAALYARLVEQGRAKWGATPAELFPEMTIDPAWSSTTIEALLDHTSGLADDSFLGRDWLMTARGDPASLVDQRGALAAKAFGAPPAGTPGAFAYSNGGYILAGAAIEAITGLSWEDAMRAEVFEPLGLASAGFGPPADGLWGHRQTPTGDLLAMEPTHPGADNPRALGPAGMAHMSIADYARFIRVFLANDGDFLTPETVGRLTTPRDGAGYALGWGVQPAAWANGNSLAHEGTNTMWHAIVVAAPGAGKAYIALSNAYGPGAASDRNWVGAMIPDA